MSARAFLSGGAAVLLVTVLAIALRLCGIGFLLPQQTEPDGVVFDKQVQILRDGLHAQEKIGLYAFYPHVVPRLVTLLPERTAREPGPRTLDEHLEAARAHRRDIRLVVALLSVLAVPATWWLGRRFLPNPWPLCAAVLMSTSVLDVWFAQEARPHAAQASFAFLAVIAAIEVRRRGGVREWICAGIAAGLALGTLQNGLAVLPPLALAGFLRARSHLDRGLTRVLSGALAALAICAASVCVFYPFLFDFAGRTKGAVGRVDTTINLSGHLLELEKFNGRGFKTVARSLWEYDPLLTSLALLGLVLGAWHVLHRATKLERGARDALWIAAAFVVPYFIAIGMYQRTYQRFALPLIPWMCLLGAFGAWKLCDLAARRGTALRYVAGASVLVTLCVQSFAAGKLVYARAQPDTIAQAAEWVRANVDPKTPVSVMNTLDLPLFQTQTARNRNESVTLDVRFPWFTYLWHLPPNSFDGPAYELHAMALATEAQRAEARRDPEGFVRNLDGEWAVIEVFSDGRFPMLIALRDVLIRNAQLVMRISPDAHDDGEFLPLYYQEDEFPRTLSWFTRVLGARCVGPVIEIYKLR